MGRPSKLTPERAKRIVELIRAGNYAEVASKASGIGESTFYAWLERGRTARSGVYREFLEAVEKAAAEAEALYLERVRVAAASGAPSTWQAAAWWLERRFPRRYGRRIVEVSGPEGGPIRTVSELTDAELERIAQGSGGRTSPKA